MRKVIAVVGSVLVAAVSVAVSVALATAAQNCDVLNGKTVNVLNHQHFTTKDVNILALPTRLTNGRVQLTEETISGGVSGQFWLTDKQRVADGFIVEFNFMIDGNGDGLGFVVQNYKNYDTLGGSGSSLGYTHSVDAYLGVSFFPCQDGDACKTQKVRILRRNPGDVNPTVISENNFIESNFSSESKGTVAYVKHSGDVFVYLNSIQVARGNVGDLLPVLYNSSYAWLGFSASVFSPNIDANIFVDSIKMDIQPADHQIISQLGEDLEWGRSLNVVVSKTNNCQIPIVTDPTSNITAVLTLTERVGEELYNSGLGMRVTVDPVISYLSASGSFNLRFDLPLNIHGTWDLAVTVDNVPMDYNPYKRAVVTKPPEQNKGIPTWGLVLLIIFVVLIVLGLLYIVFRLRRYHKKLAENKEDIEAGKEKAHLDSLERDVNFQANPLLGSLKEMQAQLEKNERDLERIRLNNGEQLDDDSTIEQLWQYNANLRKEMNKLKMEAQQNVVLDTTFDSGVQLTGKDRKQLDHQERSPP